MVLERVEVARLGARVQRDPRRLAGRVRVVRGELSAASCLGVAAAARGEDDRSGGDAALVPSGVANVARQPAPSGSSAIEPVVGERLGRTRLVRLAERLRDRVARAVTDLQEPLPRSAAAAREAVAAVRRRA